MIYIILGTKGQFMKMFPIMKLFDTQHILYKFVHTCQHFQVIENNRRRLGVRKPDVYLTKKKKDLRNMWEFFRWIPKVLWNARKLSITPADYVITHGDAESTFLAFIIGKMFRAKIVHIEAGIRSGSFFEPFPEELIRFIVSRNSDICFCPYERDANNLKGKQDVYVTHGNTVFDSVKMALEYAPSQATKKLFTRKYVLFLIHRKENLMIRTRVNQVIDILTQLLEHGFDVVWPMHTNTKYELIAKGIWKRVEKLTRQYPLRIQYFYDYIDFMHVVKHSIFVASDGGGLQVETYILNKPMLILRKVIEQQTGIGETAYCSELDMGKVQYFLRNFQEFSRKRSIVGSPSNVVVKILYDLYSQNG